MRCVSNTGILTTSIMYVPDYPSTGEKEGFWSFCAMFLRREECPMFSSNLPQDAHKPLILSSEVFLSLTQQVSKPPGFMVKILFNPQLKKTQQINKHIEEHMQSNIERTRKHL